MTKPIKTESRQESTQGHKRHHSDTSMTVTVVTAVASRISVARLPGIGGFHYVLAITGRSNDDENRALRYQHLGVTNPIRQVARYMKILLNGGNAYKKPNCTGSSWEFSCTGVQSFQLGRWQLKEHLERR